MSRFIRFIEVVAGAALFLATWAEAQSGRYERSEMAIEIPALTLTDSEGAPVRLDQLLDTEEPTALQFIFTSCPGVCPTLTATLAALGPKVPSLRRISISIDPEVDTPARMADYKKQFGGDQQWFFLTGTTSESIAAQQAFASYRGEKMRHLPLTFLRKPGATNWVRVEGFASVADLAAELGAPDLARGRRLYQEGIAASGEPIAVELAGGGILHGQVAACATCHRPSGFGGVEGGLFLPPLIGPYLFGGRENRRIDLFHELFQAELGFEVWARLRQRSARPAYSPESFQVALSTGRDPTGREFAPEMPRYNLSPADLENLRAYLANLGAVADSGVDAQAIHFAAIVDRSKVAPEEPSHLAVIEAFFGQKNADTVRLRRRSPDPLNYEEHFPPAYRTWQLAKIEIDSSSSDWLADLKRQLIQRPAFALLAGPGSVVGKELEAFCDEQNLPCLLLDAGPSALGEGTTTSRLASVRRFGPARCSVAQGAPESFRARQWLRARGIAAAADENLAMATYFLLTVTDAAVMHLLDDFSRAYFLESFDREAGRVSSPVACAS